MLYWCHRKQIMDKYTTCTCIVDHIGGEMNSVLASSAETYPPTSTFRALVANCLHLNTINVAICIALYSVLECNTINILRKIDHI